MCIVNMVAGAFLVSLRFRFSRNPKDCQLITGSHEPLTHQAVCLYSWRHAADRTVLESRRWHMPGIRVLRSYPHIVSDISPCSIRFPEEGTKCWQGLMPCRVLI